MSTDTVNNDGTTEQSLEDFAAELFGGSDAAPDNAKSEETTEEDAEVNGESEEDTLDTQTDDLDEEDVSEDDDTLAQDEDEESDDAEEVAQKPKKKNRFQERIDELTAARKEAERRADEKIATMQRELEEMRQKLEGNKDTPKDSKSEEGSNELRAPREDDVDANGKPKYPLGKYDPEFMRDTVEHMFAEREAKAKQEQQMTAEQQAQQEARAALQTSWDTKLDDARERYPDFQTKGEQMLTVFEGIDEQYGEYLTTTLMEMDNGPDVFYYLSNNIEEAQAIVAAGPKKATMELAKLEAKLGGTKVAPKKRVSQAKEPPPQNRGSAIAKPKISPDTDNLEDFSRELFRK